eukprot:scaffold94885_cov69-Phaeocystis_antarctica.AAC.1
MLPYASHACTVKRPSSPATMRRSPVPAATHEPAWASSSLTLRAKRDPNMGSPLSVTATR